MSSSTPTALAAFSSPVSKNIITIIRHPDVRSGSSNCPEILQQYIIFHDQYQQTAREISNRIFDSYYLLNYTRQTAQGLLNTNVKLKLLNDDEKILKEYANVVYGGKGVLNAYVNMLKAQKIRAKIIIEILTKAYRLE